MEIVFPIMITYTFLKKQAPDIVPNKAQLFVFLKVSCVLSLFFATLPLSIGLYMTVSVSWMRKRRKRVGLEEEWSSF